VDDTLALVLVAGLNPNQAAPLERIEVAAHSGAVQGDFGGEMADHSF